MGLVLVANVANVQHVQGVADEGTPPRDLGDTYSQSTDPSDDEEEDIVDNSHKPDTKSALHGHAREATSSAQHAQSLEGQHSDTLDTQNDPADDMDMQESED